MLLMEENLLTNQHGVENTLSLKERVVEFLEQVDMDNVDASVINDIEFFDYKCVCDDAKKYFKEIVGKETTLKCSKGKFIACEHYDGKFLKDYLWKNQ